METPKNMVSLNFPILAFSVFYERAPSGKNEIFKHYFQNFDNVINSEFIYGFISALYEFSKEAISQNQDISTCTLKNITFIYTKKADFLFLFICENYPNPEYYKVLIEDISQSFISEYREEISSYDGNMHVFNRFHEKMSHLSERYFLQIFPLNEVFIIDNDTGILLLHKTYKDPVQLDHDLFSGFITGMKDFSKFVTGEDINSLVHEDLEIIFDISDVYKVFIVFVCQKWGDPIYFRTQIQDLKEKFMSQFHDELEKWSGDLRTFIPFHEVLDKIPQKYLEDLYNKLKRKKIRIFFSYSTEDNQIFNIHELVDILENLDNIDKVYYWERDATGSIIDYMNQKVPKVDTCIFFYSEHTDEKSGVKMERDMAVYHNKHIIPIFKEIEHVPPIIRFNSGVDTSEKKPTEVAEKIYHLISTQFHLD